MGGTQSSVCDLCGKPLDEHGRYEDREALARDREEVRTVARALRDGTQEELATDEGPCFFGKQSVVAVNVIFDPCDERYAIFEICLTGGVVITKVVPMGSQPRDEVDPDYEEEESRAMGLVTRKKDD